jgi:hypothetical protein
MICRAVLTALCLLLASPPVAQEAPSYMIADGVGALLEGDRQWVFGDPRLRPLRLAYLIRMARLSDQTCRTFWDNDESKDIQIGYDHLIVKRYPMMSESHKIAVVLGDAYARIDFDRLMHKRSCRDPMLRRLIGGMRTVLYSGLTQTDP